MSPAERVAGVIGGVMREAVRAAGVGLVVLLDDGSPEAQLAHDWCVAALGANFVALARGNGIAQSLVRRPGGDPPAGALAALEPAVLIEEARRLEARLIAQAAAQGALLANPANKTALLLGTAALPEPLLPLGDLYATDMLALAGAWSAPPPVRALAELAGGIEALDGALRAHFDERRPLDEALTRVRPEARAPLATALSGARFARRRLGLVPKLGPRTLGLDLFA